jgi:hypothetical protein
MGGAVFAILGALPVLAVVRWLRSVPRCESGMCVRKRLLAMAVTAAALCSIGLAGPADAASTYGPAWGRFHASFASTPLTSKNLAHEFSYFGLKEALGFADTSSTQPFKASARLEAPSYEVIALEFGLPAEAKNAVTTARTLYSNPKKVSIGSAVGFKSFTSVNGPQIKTKKDATPRAKVFHQGVLAVARGSTMYLVVTEASRASSVTKFVNSFAPAG